jgi:drug/metabolite transporter (DMT)-like permease
MTNERITGWCVTAGLLGVVGAVLLSLPSSGAIARAASISNLRRGVAMVLLACLFWSAGDLLMQYAVKTVPALVATPLALAAGMAVYYVWITIRRQWPSVLGLARRDVLCFGIHGVVSFGLGYGTYFAAMRCIGVTRTVIITTAWPLIAFGVGLTLYREPVTFRKVGGVLLLLLSVYLIIMTR